MRKLLSILLLAVLGLPFAAPLLAQRAMDDGLPACCRKGGKHHCMMGNMSVHKDGSVATLPTVHALPERCPYCVASAAAWHPDPSASAFHDTLFVHVLTHAFVQAQSETNRRVSRDRSRQKRGPPQFSL